MAGRGGAGIGLPIGLCAAGLALLAAGAPAAAEVTCLTSAGYRVAAAERPGSVGTTVAVTALKGRPAPKTCALDRRGADYVLFGGPRDTSAMYPKALVGDHLVLDAGTGAERDLVVIDLRDRRRVLTAPADAFEVRGERVVYWERGGPAARADCPAEFDRGRAEGWVPRLSLEKAFTPATGAVRPLGGRRCEEVGDG